MLGTLISNWAERPRVSSQAESLLISSSDFNREIVRERIRASRRSIPFCVITVEVVGRNNRRKNTRILTKILHRHLRVTDQKCKMSSTKFGVLLVDTPEMGGRAVLDRLQRICEAREIRVEMFLRVHDPEGFGHDDDDHRDDIPTQNRDRGEAEKKWYRVDDADVSVSSEDPIVERSMFKMGLKRTVDIAGASVGILMTSPFVLVGMAAVKLTSPGPAFFTQTREGRRGKPFKIYKLRTMVVDAEKQQDELRDDSHRDGPAFKIKKDPRVTRVGQILRSTCLDELPQLWNVLKGDMSLVGPRPLPWHESRACSAWHRRRLDVRPGMTCNWQVNKAKAETFDDWMRMDLRYLNEMGLVKDLCLIAQTVTVPILGRGSE